MKMWKMCGSGLALLAGLSPTVRAQIAPAPPVAPPVAPVAGAPAAAAPRNLWSFLIPTQDQKLACKEKLCRTPLGQLFNNSLRPIGVFSGGMIGPFCPPASQADLAKPADSAEGAAARIKKDEAEAAARRAAVRYLGTVDCHYWPEAQDALINALRGDRNECVRFEAALALGKGCCCTRKTLEALSITVSGSEADGNPAETSDRVRMAAQAALESCLARLACPPMLTAAPGKPGEEIPKPPIENPGASLHRPHMVAMAPKQDASLVGILTRAFASPSGEGAPRMSRPFAPPPVDKPAPRSSTVATPRPAVQPMPPAVSPAPMVLPATHPQPLMLPPPAPPVNPASWNPLQEQRRLTPPRTEAPALDPQQALSTLRSNANPEQREWAAYNLAAINWQANPQAVDALLTAARKDSAAMVRAACIRSLARMGVQTMPVIGTLQELQADADPRVQQEARQALEQLTGGAKPR